MANLVLPLTFRVHRSIFGRPRKLNVATTHIEFEDNDLIGKEYTRMLKSDIRDIKFGTEKIVLHRFSIGTRYNIAVRDHQGKVLDIRFNDLFRSRIASRDAYIMTVQALQKFYLPDLLHKHWHDLSSGQDVSLGKLVLNKDSITVKGTGLNFEWGNLTLKEYEPFFVLSRTNAPEFHMVIDYNSWSADILLNLIKTFMGKQHDVTASRYVIP